MRACAHLLRISLPCLRMSCSTRAIRLTPVCSVVLEIARYSSIYLEIDLTYSIDEILPTDSPRNRCANLLQVADGAGAGVG